MFAYLNQELLPFCIESLLRTSDVDKFRALAVLRRGRSSGKPSLKCRDFLKSTTEKKTNEFNKRLLSAQDHNQYARPISKRFLSEILSKKNKTKTHTHPIPQLVSVGFYIKA